MGTRTCVENSGLEQKHEVMRRGRTGRLPAAVALAGSVGLLSAAANGAMLAKGSFDASGVVVTGGGPVTVSGTSPQILPLNRGGYGLAHQNPSTGTPGGNESTKSINFPSSGTLDYAGGDVLFYKLNVFSDFYTQAGRPQFEMTFGGAKSWNQWAQTANCTIDQWATSGPLMTSNMGPQTTVVGPYPATVYTAPGLDQTWTFTQVFRTNGSGGVWGEAIGQGGVLRAVQNGTSGRSVPQNVSSLSNKVWSNTGPWMTFAPGYAAAPPDPSNWWYRAQLGITTFEFGVTKVSDFNLDYQTNAADAAILSTNWGATGKTMPTGDATGDLKVNLQDAAKVCTNWSTPAAPGSAAGSYAPGTGEIILSLTGISYFRIISPNALLTGAAPTWPGLAGELTEDGGNGYFGAASFGTYNLTNLSLGNVGGGGTPGEMTLEYAWLGGTLQYRVLPEPTALVLLSVGALFTPRRRSR